MLAKLRLDQTKKYEQAIATYEIATMLINFTLGRRHYMRIGAEMNLRLTLIIPTTPKFWLLGTIPTVRIFTVQHWVCTTAVL